MDRIFSDGGPCQESMWCSCGASLGEERGATIKRGMGHGRYGSGRRTGHSKRRTIHHGQIVSLSDRFLNSLMTGGLGSDSLSLKLLV